MRCVYAARKRTDVENAFSKLTACAYKAKSSYSDAIVVHGILITVIGGSKILNRSSPWHTFHPLLLKAKHNEISLHYTPQKQIYTVSMVLTSSILDLK